jgi:restriction system protein
MAARDPRQRERMGVLMQAALQVLAEEDPDGQGLGLQDVLRGVERRVTLTPHERASLPKSGGPRWQSLVQFYAIDCAKAGWLVRRDRKWFLTPEGRQALALDPLTFITEANARYRAWDRARQAARDEAGAGGAGEPTSEELTRETLYEQAAAQADAELTAFVKAMGPYEFQQWVAALLHGMGYYTPYIAEPGPDGGLDILAYRDPLGGTTPRIRVQCKHRQDRVTVHEVRELQSLLTKAGDVGLIAATGGFTRDALVEMRRGDRHVEKLDLADMLRLWDEHYDQLRDEDRRRLPLKRVAFLAPRE